MGPALSAHHHIVPFACAFDSFPLLSVYIVMFSRQGFLLFNASRHNAKQCAEAIRCYSVMSLESFTILRLGEIVMLLTLLSFQKRSHLLVGLQRVTFIPLSSVTSWSDLGWIPDLCLGTYVPMLEALGHRTVVQRAPLEMTRVSASHICSGFLEVTSIGMAILCGK